MTLPNWTRRPHKVALAAFQRSRRWVNRAVGSWTRPLKKSGAVLAAVDRLVQNGVRRAFSVAEDRLGPIALLVLVAVVVLPIGFWGWLSGGESNSTTIRNLGLVVGGVAAILLAVWRSRVAERQADAAHRQVETAEHGLLNERYQQGAEMLGSDVLSVRLGGIYALQRLANEHPQEYHVQIMRLLCAFVRNPTVESYGETGPAGQETGEVAEVHEGRGGARPRQDVEAAMEAIATRSKIGIVVERDADFWLDLRGAGLRDLNLMNFKDVDLSWANISFANLSRVNLRPHTDISSIHAVKTDFSSACLVDVNLSGARLWGADLSRTGLTGADLSDAVFLNIDKVLPCRLTQAQLDSARADLNHPPRLVGVLDAETGDPLVWRGKPLDADT